jgi:hypothetical protein
MNTYRFTKKLIESISTETNLDLLKDMANYCSMKSIEALCDLGNSKQESLYDSRLALISRRYIEVIGYKVEQQLLITTDTTSHKLRTIKSIGYDTMSLVLDRCYLNILDFGGTEIVLYNSGQSYMDYVCIQSVEIIPETPIEEIKIVPITRRVVISNKTAKYNNID